MTELNKEEEQKLVVLNYLKQKGYTNSLKQFEDEADVHTLPSLSQKFVLDGKASITNFILFHGTSDTVAGDYDSNYTSLRDWVNSSLNTYRAELSTILFPIFVHCYLDLISKNFRNEGSIIQKNFLLFFSNQKIGSNFSTIFLQYNLLDFVDFWINIKNIYF